MTAAVDNKAWEITTEFALTDEERAALSDELATINANPYRQYDAFVFQVKALITADRIPQRLVDWAGSLKDRDRSLKPVVLAHNVPYDDDVPPFDFDQPVTSKYGLKKTFLAEGFLALFAELAGTPAIGYVNVNDGDVFQDIYPQRALMNSQSQKALNEIFFHKDLANHFVRPDQVYMVGMRSHEVNEVYTSFVRNIDAIAAFTDDELTLLRSKQFYTPFDDLSTHKMNKTLGDADLHPILSGEDDLRYFENRTRGITDEAQAIVPKVTEVLHRLKQRLFIRPGDFVVTYNNHTVHAKEVVKVGDPELLQTRWIIKTVNVDDVAPHSQHLIAGTGHLING